MWDYQIFYILVVPEDIFLNINKVLMLMNNRREKEGTKDICLRSNPVGVEQDFK